MVSIKKINLYKLFYSGKRISLIIFCFLFFIGTSLLSSSYIHSIYSTILDSFPNLSSSKTVQHKDIISFQEIKTIVAKISKNKAQLIQTFQGPPGLKGLVLEGTNLKHHNRQIAWFVMKSSTILFNNHLLSLNGKDLTSIAFHRYIQQAHKKAIADIPAKQFISFIDNFGNPSPVTTIQAFISADCSSCKLFLRAIYRNKKSLQDNKIAIEWIPIANSSFAEKKGGSLLQFGLTGKGLYFTKKAVDIKFIKAVKQNTRLASQFIKATPTVLYHGKRIFNWDKLIMSLRS